MVAFAGEALDSIIEELEYVQGMTVTFDSETVPDELFLPMGDYLASEIASHYSMNGPARSRAIARVRANLAPDDR